MRVITDHRYAIIFLLLTGFHILCNSRLSASHGGQSEIVIENKEMRFILYDNGKPKSLIHKETGQECLDLDNREIGRAHV